MDRIEKLFNLTMKELYPLYLSKVQRKNRSEDELIEILLWFSGYSETEFQEILSGQVSLREFFKEAKNLNENRHKITGSICGIKIQEIEDPLMKEIRYLDKFVDELAKGKTLEKIKRI